MFWSVQEKQIRAKHSMKVLSDRMRDQRLQVTDRVRKSMSKRPHLLPKVRALRYLERTAVEVQRMRYPLSCTH